MNQLWKKTKFFNDQFITPASVAGNFIKDGFAGKSIVAVLPNVKHTENSDSIFKDNQAE